MIPSALYLQTMRVHTNNDFPFGAKTKPMYVLRMGEFRTKQKGKKHLCGDKQLIFRQHCTHVQRHSQLSVCLCECSKYSNHCTCANAKFMIFGLFACELARMLECGLCSVSCNVNRARQIHLLQLRVLSTRHNRFQWYFGCRNVTLKMETCPRLGNKRRRKNKTNIDSPLHLCSCFCLIKINDKKNCGRCKN